MNKRFLDEIDIHVHFPAAATPKDGPSAGITITTALVGYIMIMAIVFRREGIQIISGNQLCFEVNF